MCNKIKPIGYSNKVCFKCLKESDNITKHILCYRGYGSDFDNFNSILQVCEECNFEDLSTWFDEIPQIDEGYYENYKYEDKIWNFVYSLPIQGRELFENQCADGAGSFHMDSQDWLDVELKIAPDSLYKKYGMYSPSEMKAYEDRFPTCENVYLKTYSDGSSCSMCRYGAHGNSDGSCDCNISTECYTCTKYSKKGFDVLNREEKDLILDKSKLKKIEMYEWTCEVCGEIVYSHIYSEHLSCPKCYQWYDLKEEEVYVYCTECAHFRLHDEDMPYCEYEDVCEIRNCEDSMELSYRPYYKKYIKQSNL